LLDKLLGASEENTYKKAELKSFLQFHKHGEEPLRDDEISILNSVLELGNKTVQSVMTPMKVSHDCMEKFGAHDQSSRMLSLSRLIKF
jgi:CBS domain containing-hemolysin-like protein